MSNEARAAPGLLRFMVKWPKLLAHNIRRRSQVVRQRSAKPRFVGSIPTGASVSQELMALHRGGLCFPWPGPTDCGAPQVECGRQKPQSRSPKRNREPSDQIRKRERQFCSAEIDIRSWHGRFRQPVDASLRNNFDPRTRNRGAKTHRHTSGRAPIEPGARIPDPDGGDLFRFLASGGASMEFSSRMLSFASSRTLCWSAAVIHLSKPNPDRAKRLGTRPPSRGPDSAGGGGVVSLDWQA